jgi:hypothetical protein
MINIHLIGSKTWTAPKWSARGGMSRNIFRCTYGLLCCNLWLTRTDRNNGTVRYVPVYPAIGAVFLSSSRSSAENSCFSSYNFASSVTRYLNVMYLGECSSVCEVCFWILYGTFCKCKVCKLLSKLSLRFRDTSSYICYICDFFFRIR